MRKLENEYKAYGHDFKIVERIGDVCIAKEEDKEHYEVFRVLKNKSRKFEAKTLEPWESIPPASKWGQMGWTFRMRDKAYAKFNELTQSHVKKTPKIEHENIIMLNRLTCEAV